MRTVQYIPARRRGFSLVELLVVVAVIGLLAAIMVPTAIRARNNQLSQLSLVTIRNIDYACQQYATDSDGVAPPALAPGCTAAYTSLVECLTGYRDDDGKAGTGFRLASQMRGKTYGPYLENTDKYTVADPDKAGEYYFVDAFGQKILYYPYHGSSYTQGDNPTGDDKVAPADINIYARNPFAGNNPYRTDYIIVSPGSDGRYRPVTAADSRTDDLTNFLNK